MIMWLCCLSGVEFQEECWVSCALVASLAHRSTPQLATAFYEYNLTSFSPLFLALCLFEVLISSPPVCSCRVAGEAAFVGIPRLNASNTQMPCEWKPIACDLWKCVLWVSVWCMGIECIGAATKLRSLSVLPVWKLSLEYLGVLWTRHQVRY